MLKAILRITVALWMFSAINLVYAADTDDESTLDQSDYDSNYYEDEGRLVFKIRACGLISRAKQTGFPTPTVTPSSAPGKLVSNGYGIDTATTIFFDDNIAAELSLGFSVLRTKSTTLSNIQNNYSVNTTDTLYFYKRRNIYMIPLTITGQYHIAPFGAIRPYLGAGYHGAYIFTKSKDFKVSNGHGPILQLGVDFVAKDDTLINFDVKQYFVGTTVNYKNVSNVSGKVKINPISISVGVGFKL